MKYCPSCKKTWPDAAKFCPVDGSMLEAEAPKARAEAPTVTDARRSSDNATTIVAPPVSASAPSAPAKKKGRAFSETKWFMVGDAIKDEELGPDEVPVEQLQKAYKPTTELPDDVRKKYSLTYGTKDDPGDAEKGK